MCTLSLFPPPGSHGEITRCEYECQLISSNWSHSSSTILNELQTFPSFKVSAESIRSPESKENCAKSAFLSGSSTIWGRIIHAWHENGPIGVLEELTSLDNSSSKSNYYVTKLSSYLSAVIRWTYSYHGSLFPHLSLSNEELVSEFCETTDWKHSRIRRLAWHSFINKFAVVLQDDTIRLETYGSNVKPVLKYRSQKNVADIAWRPYSSSQLAVASQSCVLVWTIDPSSLITRPPSSCVQMLSLKGHGPITSLAWSPDDGSLLVSASPADTAMVIWCVASESYVSLRRMGGGGVSLVRWSPDGNHLFASTPASIFRVWETTSWSCERWSNLNGRCQASCWSPDGKHLLFTTTEQQHIYHISLDGAKSALPIIDLAPVEYDVDQRVVKVGGRVQQMIWDNTGERLAVTFRGDEDDRCELIAVFRTTMKPNIEITPGGYVRGPPDTHPNYVTFKPKYDRKGSVLTVCWSNGEVSYVPLLFLPSTELNTSSVGHPKNISFNASLATTSKSYLSPLRHRTIYSQT